MVKVETRDRKTIERETQEKVESVIEMQKTLVTKIQSELDPVAFEYVMKAYRRNLESTLSPGLSSVFGNKCFKCNAPTVESLTHERDNEGRDNPCSLVSRVCTDCGAKLRTWDVEEYVAVTMKKLVYEVDQAEDSIIHSENKITDLKGEIKTQKAHIKGYNKTISEGKEMLQRIEVAIQ